MIPSTWPRPLALGLALSLALALPLRAQTPAQPPLPWPVEVSAALAAAQVPPEAVAVVLQEVDGPMLAQWQAERAMNPASLFKLVTTYAALDLLGPAWRWRTPVWLDGWIEGDTLHGHLVVQGQGDPRLTPERVWQLLRRVRQMGVRQIRGDIVLDRRAFAPPTGQPGDFDGEPLRAHNVQADALLLAQKTQLLTFTPDAAAGVARVSAEVPLDGLRLDATVPMADGACGDWRAALKARLDDPRQIRFEGRYIAACGERHWPLASPAPASWNARVLRAMWRDLGGRLSGTVRDGSAPQAVAPAFDVLSPPLAEVVRDINKFSNNVMAQQLFLTLARQRRPTEPATPEAAREVLREWLTARLGEPLDGLVIDNGSGLSRDNRVSARQLAALLQQAWRSPLMPEMLNSLPVAGRDGTMRRSMADGRAHLKTGSLRDVVAVAGVLHTANGRRRVLVAMVQHPNASAARPALEALVQWGLSPEPVRP